MTCFAEALGRLWVDADRKIPGLHAGMIAAAPDVFARYGVTTPLLVAHVMAQISHECGAGRDVVENLDYTARRMMQVWPGRFPTLASAAPYAHDPQALAKKVYNGRMGNAPGSDDGWRFRGRGAAQTTGRDGYARLAKATGLDLENQPDLVNDPRYFLNCGVADFVGCGCLPFARADDIVGVTRRLNGGLTGLDQRRAWLTRWKAALGPAPVVVASPPLAPELPSASPPAAAASASHSSRWQLLIAAMAAALRRT
ncbi:glycoside hydrolase family 19 protein [Rhodopseudomonas sp. B29]|uniref:glycoside hydrolase family 19 protein n=1 Tax=Rhodopseudomonas sp. B29 TaxID=95607 RepID=UPI0003B51DF9|nr:glycoside hydrolase family 19 protein [Rhodopseudomonas sp. B29]